MVWNPSIDLLLCCCLFFDDNMKQIRENATLYPHLNYINTKDDNEMQQLNNGPYRSKLDF